MILLLCTTVVLPLARSNTPIQQCLQDLVNNTEMGRLLDEIQSEGYEEAAVERYLHDFVHMVHKPIVPEEEKVWRDISRNWLFTGTSLLI